MKRGSMKYSVLMSVYFKENPEYLSAAMQSIFEQTTPTDDFVLVCDGPLGRDLDTVIDKMRMAHNEVMHVIRLEKNVGLGKALNYGIKYCKNELVARMDSDDISRLDRCECQLKVFLEQPEVSICSGIVEEFSVTTDMIDARRIPPEKQDDILTFAKYRNPFNHPCVMYKKTAVEKAGGYQDFYLLEDYFLWIRMLQNGEIGYNIQKPLLWMRAGSGLYKRRAGLKYAISQKALFKYMRENGFITELQYLTNSLLRGVSSIAPNWIRKIMFESFVRK